MEFTNSFTNKSAVAGFYKQFYKQKCRRWILQTVLQTKVPSLDFTDLILHMLGKPAVTTTNMDPYLPSHDKKLVFQAQKQKCRRPVPEPPSAHLKLPSAHLKLPSAHPKVPSPAFGFLWFLGKCAVAGVYKQFYKQKCRRWMLQTVLQTKVPSLDFTDSFTNKSAVAGVYRLDFTYVRETSCDYNMGNQM